MRLEVMSGGGTRVGAAAEARPWVERAARLGYAAKGAVYLVIGILTFQAAAGAGGDVTGSEGALRTILQQPFGRVLLGLTALGLAGYALWRAITAVLDPEGDGGRGAKRVAARVGFAASAVIHAGLAWQAAALALRERSGGGDGARDWTARLLDAPLGPWLVGLVGLAVAGYGVYQLRRGFSGNVAERLRLGAMSGEERSLVLRAGRIGLAARGVVFLLIALFLARAALEADPSEAGGLAEALQTLQRQPYAPVLLGAVAVGLAAYGAFQLAKARYRTITPL